MKAIHNYTCIDYLKNPAVVNIVKSKNESNSQLLENELSITQAVVNIVKSKNESNSQLNSLNTYASKRCCKYR